MRSSRRDHPLDLAIELFTPGVRPPAGLLTLLLERGTAAHRAAVASSCQLCPEQIDRLLARGELEVDLALARSDALGRDHIATLAARDDAQVTAALVTCPALPYGQRPALVARYLAHVVEHGWDRSGFGQDRRKAISGLLAGDPALRREVAAAVGILAVLTAVELPQLLPQEVAALVEAITAVAYEDTPPARQRLAWDLLSRTTLIDRTPHAERQLRAWLAPELADRGAQVSPEGRVEQLSDLERTRVVAAAGTGHGELVAAVSALPYAQVAAGGTPAFNSLALGVYYQELGDDLEAWRCAAAMDEDLDEHTSAAELLATFRRLIQQPSAPTGG